MSYDSWIAENYPIDAEGATENDLMAIDHALLKWRGLRKKALEKHGVILCGISVCGREGKMELPELPIDSRSCALCVRHLVPDIIIGKRDCSSCPLFEVRGMACDAPKGRSPYTSFALAADPEPTIDLLERAREKVLEKLSIQG